MTFKLLHKLLKGELFNVLTEFLQPHFRHQVDVLLMVSERDDRFLKHQRAQNIMETTGNDKVCLSKPIKQLIDVRDFFHNQSFAPGFFTLFVHKRNELVDRPTIVFVSKDQTNYESF